MSPAWRSRPVRALVAVLAVLAVLEATVVPHYSPKFPWHRLPGYAGLIAIVAVVGLVFGARALGQAGLQRPEREDD